MIPFLLFKAAPLGFTPALFTSKSLKISDYGKEGVHRVEERFCQGRSQQPQYIPFPSIFMKVISSNSTAHTERLTAKV